MTKTIAFINQKGGTGKTTSTVNIGAGLARLKQKVLAVDLDPQASCTVSTGIHPSELQKSSDDHNDRREKQQSHERHDNIEGSFHARIFRIESHIYPSSSSLSVG